MYRRTPVMAMLLAAGQLVVSTSGSAQEQVRYRAITVASQLKLEVPAHWHVRDPSDRRNIATAADALRDAASQDANPMHVSALSVISVPEPVGAIIRVSFLPGDGVTQTDLNLALKRDRQATINAVAETWKREMAELIAPQQPPAIQILGSPTFDSDTIGGKTAISILYRRTSAIGQSPFLVAQYHVPLGKVKALITLSHRESSSIVFRPILDRVKRSVVFMQ